MTIKKNTYQLVILEKKIVGVSQPARRRQRSWGEEIYTDESRI